MWRRKEIKAIAHQQSGFCRFSSCKKEKREKRIKRISDDILKAGGATDNYFSNKNEIFRTFF